MRSWPRCVPFMALSGSWSLSVIVVPGGRRRLVTILRGVAPVTKIPDLREVHHGALPLPGDGLAVPVIRGWRRRGTGIVRPDIPASQDTDDGRAGQHAEADRVGRPVPGETRMPADDEAVVEHPCYNRDPRCGDRHAAHGDHGSDRGERGERTVLLTRAAERHGDHG